MQNRLPTNSAQLIALGTQMESGLVADGATLGITQITPAAFLLVLNAFGDADSAFNSARSTEQMASNAYHLTTAAINAWLQTVRGTLVGRFGIRWSTLWAQAGFTDATTAVPARLEEQIGLVLSLVNFLTANPDFEVPSMDVTAAKATALRSASLAALATLTTAKMALDNKGTAWTTAYEALVKMMRRLIKILAATLAPDDARWMAFGLNMPAAITTPGKPVNVVAHLDGTGAIIVQCDAVPLATRYRWRMLIVGVQTDYVLAARSIDPMGTISDVLPGQTVKLIVQAVNGSSQGVASDPILFTIPLVEAAHAPVAAETAGATTAVVSAERNGANGHANGHRLPALG
jgi:hypothetical protein